jgi:hypothetical protein
VVVYPLSFGILYLFTLNRSFMFADDIVKIARSYIGQDEIPPNMGFKDPVFDAKMRAVGFINSYAWCSLFAKLVWLEASKDNLTLQAKIRRLCGPSALGTLHNFGQAGGFVMNKIPAPGCIVVWKHGTDPAGYLGHAGIVTAAFGMADYSFTSVEGNTSPTDPNERNGGTTAEKRHSLNLPPNPHGLNLVSFIHPL